MINFSDLKVGNLVILERTEEDGFFAGMESGDLTLGEYVGIDEDGDCTFLVIGPFGDYVEQHDNDAASLVKVLEIL